MPAGAAIRTGIWRTSRPNSATPPSCAPPPVRTSPAGSMPWPASRIRSRVSSNVSRIRASMVCQIIEARMRETFELTRDRMREAGHGMLPAGLVLTGGGAQLGGVAELGREVLQMPVRIAAPAGIGGLVDGLLTPAYSNAIGLLLWGARELAAGEPVRYESAPALGGLGRIRDALRSIFP